MITAGIVGATGYTGVELLRLLANHSQVEVKVITSRSEAGRAVSDLYPNLRGYYDLAFTVPKIDVLLECDVIFFATPHGVAQTMMSDYFSSNSRASGPKIIDLSADFRIKDITVWESWYGQKHNCPELVNTAVYGLPETHRKDIKDASLVACPGCYPTSIQLGFLPLLENNLVNVNSLIANSASGITGAGRNGKVDFLHTETSDSFKAYGVSGHRHLPESEQGLRAMVADDEKQSLSLTFVPHLLPMNRGIHSTLYARLKPEQGNIDLQALYAERYANEPFVDVLPEGVFPQTRSVKGSNVCRLSVSQPQNNGTVVVMSAIDNLTKGASGQAIQNMNIMFGFDETCGLELVALMP